MYSPEELAMLQQAMQVLQSGQLAPAEALLTEMLGRWPANAEALHLLGLIEAQSGRAEQGLARIGQALALQPQAAHMHANLARLLQALGRHDEAAVHYRRVTGLEPGNTAAWFALAELSYDLQRSAEARAAYQQVTALDPAHAAAWLGLGNTSFVSGDDAAAEAAYLQVLALRPESPGALNNLGYIAYRRKQYPQAQAWVEQALALNPDYPEAWENLATIHRSNENCEAAALAYERVCALSYRPGLVVKNALMVPGVYHSQAEMKAWRDRFSASLDQLLASDIRLRDPSAEVGEMPFFLHYHPQPWLDLARKLAAFYRQACPALDWTAPHCLVPGEPRTRLRLAIVSMHFRPTHSIGKVFGSLVTGLDRSRFELSLCLFEPAQDAESRAFVSQADQVLQLPRDFFAARAALAEARFDAIVYPEIGSDYVTYFLAFARLAPLQAVLWGLGSSTGLESLDYFYSSSGLETEASRACYSETLVETSHLLPCFPYPDYPAQTMSRADFGLPAEGLLYGCLQSAFKLQPAFDSTLARILAEVPGSRLVLLEGQHACWSDKLRQRLQQSLGADYARVHFVPRQPEAAYLQLAGCCDVLLDPWPICGGNTTYDVLATGTPLVSQTGSLSKHRLSHAILAQLGFTDCVTSSPEAYAELAIRLGHDSAARARVKAEILARLEQIYSRREGLDEFMAHLYQATQQRLEDLQPAKPDQDLNEG